MSRLLYHFIIAIALVSAAPCWTLGQSAVDSQSSDQFNIGAAPGSAVKVLPTRLRGFGVPFQINADDSAFIEVQLYLSSDQGRTWRFFAKRTTDQTEFPFQADGDGEYWFALKTLTRDRQLLPSGDPQPALKILVDTQKPELEFRVHADPAGRIVCRWQAKDSNLQPASLKLYYQSVTGDGPQGWQPVPVELGGVARNGVYSDQVGWWPDTTETTVNVAIQIQDVAGNAVQDLRRVKLPSTSWRNHSQNTARPAGQPPSATQSQLTLKPSQSTPGTLAQPSPTAGLPKQPDWAYPGWQSKPANGSLPPQTSATTKQPTAQDQPLRDEHSISDDKKPAGVICQNGVCRLKPAAARQIGQQASTTIKQAKNALADTVDRAGVSQHRLATTAANPLVLVGSSEEFIAPPLPVGYAPATSPIGQQNNQTSRSNQQSITWESDSQPGSTAQPSNGLRRKFDPTISPLPTGRSAPAGPATTVPSNPSQMFFEGDKVISQSSTQGPRNQYRGNRTIGQLPPPVLLPNQAAVETPVEKIERQVSGPQRPQGMVDRSQRSLAATHHQQSNPSTSDGQRNVPPKQFRQTGFRRGQDVPKSIVENKQQPNRPTRAPVKIIGSKRFRLNYGIDAIDPSGVDKVVLWITRDDGQNWKSWGTDPDNRSPFPVEVVEDARYGFRIVVKSKDGLTGQGPMGGSDADIWITVDTQSPLVRITSVPYGRGPEAGKLVVHFKASDLFLTLRPITISYAANPAGPWQIIEDGIRNQDRYLWKVGRDVPEQVFLKIEAVDRAGNVGVHVLNQPIDVSGLVPRGTIHGVTPVAR